MLQKRNKKQEIFVVFLFLLQDMMFFKDMSDDQGRRERFSKFEQCRIIVGEGLEIDVFVGRLSYMGPKLRYIRQSFADESGYVWSGLKTGD